VGEAYSKSLEGKEEALAKEKKYARKVGKPACGRQDAKKVSRVKPWRLSAFARALFLFSQRREAAKRTIILKKIKVLRKNFEVL
jgi:hypothetical protein